MIAVRSPVVDTTPRRVDVDVVPIEVAADAGDRGLLAPDELERAGRFAFPRDAERYVAARAGLRRCLAQRLGVDPRHLVFAADDYGKPRLVEPAGSTLGFNVSHGRDRSLVAVAATGSLGVDIEEHRPLVGDPHRLAERYFAAPERSALIGRVGGDLLVTFLRIWTQKEAYVKAIGMGLSLPLDRFSVPAHAGASATIASPDGIGRWHLRQLDLGPGVSAAVALDRPIGDVRLGSAVVGR